MIISLDPPGRNPYIYLEDEDPPSDPYSEDGFEEAIDTPVDATPSEFVEFAIHIPSKGGLDNFSFDNRGYLRAVYDTPATRKLIMAGRQVEKCLPVTTHIVRENGYLKMAGDVKVGDRLATMVNNGSQMGSSRVDWVSKRYTKPCVKITTRQGHEVAVATTHPMRKFGGWVPAGELEPKDRLAVVRRCGEFLDKPVQVERIKVTAYLIGDGGLGGGVSFTSANEERMADYVRLTEQVGCEGRMSPPGKRAPTYRLQVGSPVHAWLKSDGLLGKLSPDKFVSRWVFSLGRKDTALFLRTLWSTDGHIRKVSPSKHDIIYSSIAKRLVLDVQSLLWKFGIPTGLRSYVPEVYEGTDKVHWMLRVETQAGINLFLSEISNIDRDGKTVAYADKPENNNRDTYPIEINDLLVRIQESGDDSWQGRRAGSLHAKGLRRTLKYPPTNKKLQDYYLFFRQGSYDQGLVEELGKHVYTDLYWDEIEAIEDVGEQECVDFRVEDTHNFVADGFVTHNSTYLGNICLSYAAMIPFFRVLYVSPSNQQTKVFSRDRIKEPIEISPVLRTFTNSRLLANVLEKKFVNQSQITMRFAFLNADRTRGIPADLVLIDEFQDILLDNVPVIEECVSHSDYKYFNYSGTPKSMDNAIEHYWSRFSTQNEWVVPCKKHGTPKNPSSWHWNILDEENIGDHSLICDKCGGVISPRDPDSTWASLNPEPSVEKPYEGYRIPQLMVPWIEFDDIKDKQRKYSRAKFHNEVLGRSYDSGTRPLTRSDMIRNSWSELSMTYYREVIKYASQYPVFMGIDWGCHDNKTRILTKRGFVHFWDLTDDDKVAQFDPASRRMSYVKPSVRTCRPWNGWLYHFKNDQVDMMLTPTHRMLILDRSGPKIVSAEEAKLMGGHTTFVNSVWWNGNDHVMPDDRVRTLMADVKNGGRIPRELLNLTPPQIRVLLGVLMEDFSPDKEGGFVCPSKGLCEDVQEACLKLGLSTEVSASSKGWMVTWSPQETVEFDLSSIQETAYDGYVYCCKVPSGCIVTERNGKVGFQGNTGEGTFTVVSLGGYLPFAPERFVYFYLKRFEGVESDPRRQLQFINQTARDFNVQKIGVDYGGGFWPNDELVRTFGSEIVVRYQWVGQVKKKIVFEPRLGVPRFLCHRTEVMSDIFNAIKRANVFRYPRWEEFEDPFANDFLNIFSEYNERLRMNVYKHAAGYPDDAFHSCTYAFLASFFHRKREDVILPSKELEREEVKVEDYDVT